MDEGEGSTSKHLVSNPIYSDSQPGANENRADDFETECYDVLRHNVGTVRTFGAYAQISDLPEKPSRAYGVTNTEEDHHLSLQSDQAESDVYAQLGAAEGIIEFTDSEEKSAVKESSELESPYSNLF